MKKTAFALGAAALLSLGALATTPAQAYDGRYDNRVIVVPAPPPPPRAYYAPQPRYYGHDDRRYYGHDDRRYYHRERGWGDRDRDGVPNRYDRDRDGDGVPNYYDRRPNNPYRY
jgi:hypothetical protein